MSPVVLRWSFSGCVLFPPTTRITVLILVLAFVLLLFSRGYDLATTLAAVCGAGLVTTQLSQRMVRIGSMPVTVPSSVV